MDFYSNIFINFPPGYECIEISMVFSTGEDSNFLQSVESEKEKKGQASEEEGRVLKLSTTELCELLVSL